MILLKRIPTVLFYTIVWRLISVFVVQTAHVPDEYWQSVEVAHQLAFGYGYLTWEWREGIRSYIYPLLISVLYRTLELFHLDYVALLITLPRILQALLTAYADYRFYVWTRNKWALFNLCTNWYWYYCASRTLLNTLETSLTTIALSIFPWKYSSTDNIRYLWTVAFLCAIRPTAAVIWTPLCLYHILTTTSNRIGLLLNYLKIGIVTLAVSTLIDAICYRKFIITQIEFLRGNVFNHIGDFYGSENIFWYITTGIPVLLGLHCLMVAIGAWQTLKNPAKFYRQGIMLAVIGWTIAIYSLISHKEFRFILPLLPLFTCLSTAGIVHLNYSLSPFKQKICMAVLTIFNLLPGIYFCLIHQRGSLDVMNVLRQEISSTPYHDVDILFLTPCHATPLYSHLHANVSIKFLTCEPDLENRDSYMDEAEHFFAKPMLWLSQTYSDISGNNMPTHVVLFDKLAPKIDQFLDQYVHIARLFYAHFTQGNYSQYLHVYKKKITKRIL